jgi:tight adherence protein C
MTTILLPIALLLLFVAIVLLAFSLLPGGRGTAVRGMAFRQAELDRLPRYLRIIYPLLDGLSPLVKRIPWASYRAHATTQLQRAGIAEALTVDHMLVFKVLCAIVLPLLGAQVLQLLRNPGVYVLAVLGAFYLPDKIVTSLRQRREKQIVRAMPGAVDVLSLSVEAGLEFLLALQRQVERGLPGALRDELATILNDIRLGKSRAEALKAFATRVEMPEISSFVSVLVQADALGASIGPVLKMQAERMRVERFQRAEREGARASQKILFPLVLFIFPSVLIVILGPVILQFIYAR